MRQVLNIAEIKNASYGYCIAVKSVFTDAENLTIEHDALSNNVFSAIYNSNFRLGFKESFWSEVAEIFANTYFGNYTKSSVRDTDFRLIEQCNFTSFTGELLNKDLMQSEFLDNKLEDYISMVQVVVQSFLSTADQIFYFEPTEICEHIMPDKIGGPKDFFHFFIGLKTIKDSFQDDNLMISILEIGMD